MTEKSTESRMTFIAIGVLILALAAAAAGYLNQCLNGRERTFLVSGALGVYWLFGDVIAPITGGKWKETGRIKYVWNLIWDLVSMLGICGFLYGTGAGGGVNTALAGAVLSAAAMVLKHQKRNKNQGMNQEKLT